MAPTSAARHLAARLTRFTMLGPKVRYLGRVRKEAFVNRWLAEASASSLLSQGDGDHSQATDPAAPLHHNATPERCPHGKAIQPRIRRFAAMSAPGNA
jgi:hypothetical protein